MDCKQFEDFLPELLYPQRASSIDQSQLQDARQHAQTCPRCHQLLESLTSARDSLQLPSTIAETSLQPLRERLLQVCDTDEPSNIPNRWVRLLAWAGRKAMSPQVATAALLVLLLATSLLLLSGSLGNHAEDMQKVTENGTPESPSPVASSPTFHSAKLPLLRKHMVRGSKARRSLHERSTRKTKALSVPLESNGSRAASSAGQPPPDQPTKPPMDSEEEAELQAARALYESGHYVAARRAFDKLALQGGKLAAEASLYSALSVRASSGCDRALPLLETVVARFGQSEAGKRAKWETAICARVLGDYIRARIILRELASDPNYKKRAREELKRITPASRLRPAPPPN